VDEKTGMQALERIAPTKPARPRLVERREFEYIRHGTQCLIASLDVVTGKVFPSIGDTRTEVDFAAHIAATIDADPDAPWVFVSDQLDTHKSETLVRLVAERCGITEDLGKKGKTGVLRRKGSRMAFLSDPTHRIRFVYTPRHCSWLNQIEIWFSTLGRRLLNRGSFASTDCLRRTVLDFIDYHNRAWAKPYRWTYTGRPLEA
jgi:transposase